MDLVLTNTDITELDKMIQEIPFKYAFGMFQFLRQKLQEQAQKEQAAKIIKAEEIAVPS